MLVAAVAELEPGRALELGCGTGENVLYLARHRWFATGVDASSGAVESARRKADWTAGATFLEGDPAAPSRLGVDGPFDLVVDAGAFDTVPAARRDVYVDEVARIARPGARLLLFASDPGARRRPGGRITEAEVRGAFHGFELTKAEPARAPSDGTWFTLTRVADPAPS